MFTPDAIDLTCNTAARRCRLPGKPSSMYAVGDRKAGHGNRAGLVEDVT
jgi:hypothetical protein